jgi:hypothetical protein
MAKDPVCGMFVEKKPDSIGYAQKWQGILFLQYAMFKRI